MAEPKKSDVCTADGKMTFKVSHDSSFDKIYEILCKSRLNKRTKKPSFQAGEPRKVDGKIVIEFLVGPMVGNWKSDLSGKVDAAKVKAGVQAAYWIEPFNRRVWNEQQ